jgi:hypothetical protein
MAGQGLASFPKRLASSSDEKVAIQPSVLHHCSYESKMPQKSITSYSSNADGPQPQKKKRVLSNEKITTAKRTKTSHIKPRNLPVKDPLRHTSARLKGIRKDDEFDKESNERMLKETKLPRISLTKMTLRPESQSYDRQWIPRVGAKNMRGLGKRCSRSYTRNVGRTYTGK